MSQKQNLSDKHEYEKYTHLAVRYRFYNKMPLTFKI